MEAARDALFAGHSAFVDDDFELAVQRYSDALCADPNSADAFSSRAAARLKMHQHELALSDASRAVGITPSANSHKRVGLACFALGRFQDAREAFSSALELSSPRAELKRWVRKCDAELSSSGSAGTSGSSASTPPTTAQPAAPPPAAPPAPSATAQPTDPSKIRHEWYQTMTHVVVSVIARGMSNDAVNVSFSDTGVHLTLDLNGSASYKLDLRTFAKLDADGCKYSVGAAKIEVKLKKQVSGKWEKLEGDGTGSTAEFNTVVDAAPRSVYSGSSKNWDAIDSDLTKKEEEEKPEGEEALNKLFRDIYSKADENTRRAMNKSFQTSGGTVLSTNWGEVSEADYEKTRTAPDGQEWKKWG